jgi:hypothetical protein
MNPWTVILAMLAFFVMLYTVGNFLVCRNMSDIKVTWCERFL